MSWQKVAPFEGTVHIGCLNCAHGNGLLDLDSHAPTERLAHVDMTIAVGFGNATVTRDGVIVYDEQSRMSRCERIYQQFGDEAAAKAEEELLWTVRRAEEAAAVDPDHDWRITMYGPLHGEEYQRHGPDRWVLIDSNMGFA